MTKKIRKKQHHYIFDRVVAILEEARSNIVHSVNSNMVVAYWLIGREIVEEVQSGSKRAEYGKQVLETLSANLQKAYGRGFSVPNLQNFRKFYQAFQTRLTIQYPPGTEFPGAENSLATDDDIALESNQYLQGREFAHGFLANLSWSHYRALMRVKDEQARNFYERDEK